MPAMSCTSRCVKASIYCLNQTTRRFAYTREMASGYPPLSTRSIRSFPIEGEVSATVGSIIRLAEPVSRKRPGRLSSSILFLMASSS